ncbi:MAG TPA: AMP-binding protein [Acidimicrobiia bacterium]|nr:AMP-binding protein [Acidimicrobiia bacterium]
MADLNIATRFEAAVELDPNAPAVRTRHRQVTFEELNDLANRVAWHVLENVGRVDDPITTVYRDDISLIAAMLGVVKTGNVVLPIDAGDPTERMLTLIERARSSVILADEVIGRTLELPHHDPLGPGVGPTGSGNPLVEIDSDDPAVLIFTSGTTGTPKGVLRGHHGFDTAFAGGGSWSVGPGSRVSLLPSLAFTSGIGAVFTALLSGATACRFDPKMEGIHRLGTWIRTEEITHLWVGPASLRRMLDDTDPHERFPTVRVVYASGAPLLRRDVELFQRHFSEDCVMINSLAMTETGIVARYIIEKDTPIDGDVIPVGYPMEGVRVFLIDEDGREVEAGQTGMIHVESPYLVSGYWRDPDMTARSFVPHPSGGEGTVYRAGDLAIEDDDGRIRLVGRTDDRIKIRGYSVDLLEVERSLAGLKPIRDAIVVDREIRGESRIVAYFVPERKRRVPTTSDLRESLAKVLPEHALPSTFVPLDAIPLTARGKVDKKALPDADAARRRRRRSRKASDDLERALVDIWEGVLGLEPVGVDEHFFDELAGTSMQALRVFAQIARRLDLDLAPTTLLAAPTISSLAAVIRAGGGSRRQSSLVPVRREGSRTPFFCVHGGGGGAFFVRDMAVHLDADRPVYGLQAGGFDGVPTPYRSVEEMAARYLAELQTVQPRGPYLLGGLSLGGLVALEMAQLLERQGDRAELLVMLDTHLPSAGDGDMRLAEGGHLQRMSRLGVWGKVRYLVSGVWRRLNDYRRIAQVAVWTRAGLTLSDRLRDFHFWRMGSRASKSYRPDAYDGAVLFVASRGGADRRRDQWEPLLRGPFEIVEVDAPHDDLVIEPSVQLVCAELEKGFDAARV